MSEEAAPEKRKAAQRLVQFVMHNPLGEELFEGALGGLMAGAAQIGTDTAPEQLAVSTLAAMAGGIGVGMAGRRLGAVLGKRVHEGALADQTGMVANLSRMVGSETTASGLRDQGAVWKNAIQNDILERTSASLMREAVEDPNGFAKRYNISPDQFQMAVPTVRKGQQASAAVSGWSELSPEKRKALMKQLGVDSGSYEKTENLINREAASRMDEIIKEQAAALDRMQRSGSGAMDAEDMESLEGFLNGRSPGDAVRSLLNPVEEITGEHVGRAIGRVLGDEAGILGGLAAGSMLGQSMGIETSKDREIRELKTQLGIA
jgi:hypothetical protein